MCGRYRLTRADKLAQNFDVEYVDELAPRYNIAPSQMVAVVRQDPVEPKRRLTTMRWGLIPFWAKDPTIGYKMINARSETVAEKPAFREALKRRRCLIPADGFYEWQKNGKSKTPFCFTMADDAVFAFAGLWEQWKNPEGTLVETCTILTTTPNALLADVHDRMPVILPDESYELWLDPGFHKTDAVCDLLKPFDPRLMRRYEVSTRVNSPRFDDADCAAPALRASGAGAS